MVDPERYVEAHLVLPRVHADAVCNFIIENIAPGLVLEDEEDAPTVGVTFYVPGGESSYQHGLAAYLKSIAPDLQVTIDERPVRSVEWVEQYKSSVKPISIGEDIVVRPTWAPREPGTRFDIIIEPKMAFGTGSHETTRSCLIAIRKRFQSGWRFLDVGCGSGILSILASQMGASAITAIDYDLTAVENCRENLSLNGVGAPADVLFGSIEKADPARPYQCVCANIIKSTILPMLDRLWDRTASPGVLILSGLLTEDEADMRTAVGKFNPRALEIIRDGKWVTFVIDKP